MMFVAGATPVSILIRSTYKRLTLGRDGVRGRKGLLVTTNQKQSIQQALFSSRAAVSGWCVGYRMFEIFFFSHFFYDFENN